MTKQKITQLKAELPGISQLTIETNSGSKVTMNFTNPAMARQEHQRIHASGVYCGEWIKQITYNENLL